MAEIAEDIFLSDEEFEASLKKDNLISKPIVPSEPTVKLEQEEQPVEITDAPVVVPEGESLDEDDLIDVSVDDQEISPSEEEPIIEVVGGEEKVEVAINPEVKDDETFGVTTIDDAFEALYNRQVSLPVEERSTIRSMESFMAEEDMIAGYGIDDLQAWYLMPPTEKMIERQDMSSVEILADMRQEEYDRLENDLQYQQRTVEDQVNERVYLASLSDPENLTYVVDPSGYPPLTDTSKVDRDEIREQVIQENKNAIDNAYQTADYYLNNRNAYMREVAQKTFLAVERGNITIQDFNALMVMDEFFDPVNALFEIPHNWEGMQEALRNGDLKGAGTEALMAGLNLASATPGARLVSKSVTKGWKALSGGRGAYLEVQEAMANEGLRAYDIKKLARKTANENKELRNQLIREFEDRFDVTISVELPDGNLAVDPKLVRATGKEKVSEYFDEFGYVTNDGKTVSLTDFAINDESLAIPILDPDKLDMFVATVVGLQKNEKFAKALETSGKERLVDKLFDATLNKELLGSEELLDQLTKNGLAFEEFVLGVVGSGSEAGKLLNKLSQINRFKPKSTKELQDIKARIETQKAFGRWWTNVVLRTENVRRGLLVSSLATTMRNVQSAGMRMPMESMADIMDSSILTYQIARANGASTPKALLKLHNAINPLVRDGTWSGAFKNLRYVFMDQQRAQEFTDYILKRPQLIDEFETLFNNINEIQSYTGRGQARNKFTKSLDKGMSKVEDMVWTVNGPNRWQEHMIRRATFMSELERKVKIEWGLDLQTALKEGKIDDLIRDASSVRPEGGRSFQDMVSEATDKALDVTYGKQPDFFPFKYATEVITKSGLTTIIPFPRFMFNSMEYMAQNSVGAFLVPIRKAVYAENLDDVFSLTPRDRQDITRNLVGLATMKTFYDMRIAGLGTEDYTMVTDGEGNQVDISAQFPLRQMSWLAEFARRGGLKEFGIEGEEDTLDTWYGMNLDEFTETWMGSSARTGTGNVFVKEIINAVKGVIDPVDEAKSRKAIGRAIGQYMGTFLTPVFQLSESQRVAGIRTEQAKDFKGSIDEDSNLPFDESPMIAEMYRVLAQRGLAAPSFEEELPQRIGIDGKKINRPNSAYRLYLGLSIAERDSDTISYLKDIGYGDPTYELGSKSRIPENKLAENEYISAVLPTMVDVVKELVEDKHGDDSKRKQNLFARKLVREAANSIREEFNDPNYGGASQVAIIVDSLQRVNKEDRRYGIQMFKEKNGRIPNIKSLEDMTEYAEYCRTKYFSD